MKKGEPTVRETIALSNLRGRTCCRGARKALRLPPSIYSKTADPATKIQFFRGFQRDPALQYERLIRRLLSRVYARNSGLRRHDETSIEQHAKRRRLRLTPFPVPQLRAPSDHNGRSSGHNHGPAHPLQKHATLQLEATRRSILCRRHSRALVMAGKSGCRSLHVSQT
jgi:hypothetical protein